MENKDNFVKFETQEEDEKVVLVVRSHPVIFLKYLFNFLIFLILIIFFNIFLFTYLNFSQRLLFNILFVLFFIFYFWSLYLTWYFNVGLITNKRIIDIDFYFPSYKEITEVRFGNIEDITIKSGGFFESFFHIGTIFIQTANTEQNIEFYDVIHPVKIVEKINYLTGKKDGN